MPAILTMHDQSEERVTDSVEAVKKKRTAGGWQSFVTTAGNVCKINTAKIVKIAPARV